MSETGIAASPRRLKKIPPQVGFLAELFVVVTLLFGLAGAGWGLWRPIKTGTVGEHGGVAITDPAMYNGNLEFSAFGTMTLCFFVLGLVSAGYLLVRSKVEQSLGSMLWLVVCTFLGSVTFYLVGTKVALTRVDMPDLSLLEVGDPISFIPAVQPGIALLVAPFVASFTSWIALALARPSQ